MRTRLISRFGDFSLFARDVPAFSHLRTPQTNEQSPALKSSVEREELFKGTLVCLRKSWNWMLSSGRGSARRRHVRRPPPTHTQKVDLSTYHSLALSGSTVERHRSPAPNAAHTQRWQQPLTNGAVEINGRPIRTGSHVGYVFRTNTTMRFSSYLHTMGILPCCWCGYIYIYAFLSRYAEEKDIVFL